MNLSHREAQRENFSKAEVNLMFTLFKEVELIYWRNFGFCFHNLSHLSAIPLYVSGLPPSCLLLPPLFLFLSRVVSVYPVFDSRVPRAPSCAGGVAGGGGVGRGGLRHGVSGCPERWRFRLPFVSGSSLWARELCYLPHLNVPPGATVAKRLCLVSDWFVLRWKKTTKKTPLV